MDFNTTPPTISFADRSTIMHVTNVSMADSLGKLLFYTNGCDIFNKNDNIMENGNDINPGSIHNSYCSGSFNAYPAIRGGIAFQAESKIYYLFHQGIKLVTTDSVFDVFLDKLYYSKIDMEQNNGLGKVIEKNVLVLEDTMHSGDLTAVKHNNNVDWWIITPKRTSNVYFKIHFTPNGIESVNTQSIGDSTLYAGDGGGQAIFSPNGTKYIRYNPADDIQIFDFDRSTGELSNYQHIIIPQDTAFVGGAAISPNSRYLYISSQVKFYQYDLQAPDIAASQVLLGEYDGYMSPFATTFFSCQLAPDCKIYCCTYNGCDVLHVVNYPDEPGLACDFVQHGVQLPSYNTLSMPNFPNYRLGTGQPVCVPTANDEVKLVQSEIKVYPNPANGQVTVLLPAPLYNESTWSLHDALGREVASAVLSAPQGQAGKQEAEVGLAGVASGLYFWRVVNGRGTVGSGKLIIIKD